MGNSWKTKLEDQRALLLGSSSIGNRTTAVVEEFPLVAAATAPQEAAAGTNVKVTKADGNTSGGRM